MSRILKVNHNSNFKYNYIRSRTLKVCLKSYNCCKKNYIFLGGKVYGNKDVNFSYFVAWEFSFWLWTQRISDWFKINRKMVNTIQIWFVWTRLCSYFSVNRVIRFCAECCNQRLCSQSYDTKRLTWAYYAQFLELYFNESLVRNIIVMTVFFYYESNGILLGSKSKGKL